MKLLNEVIRGAGEFIENLGDDELDNLEYVFGYGYIKSMLAEGPDANGLMQVGKDNILVKYLVGNGMKAEMAAGLVGKLLRRQAKRLEAQVPNSPRPSP